MKKISLIVICCICAHSVYAGTCEKTAINFSEVQTAVDDEFLYEGEYGYSLSEGYECDNEFCEDGTTITMFPGHFYKGEQVNETVTYKCNVGLADKWEAISNDESGDIITHRWCDSTTEVGQIKAFYEGDDSFENMKTEMVEKVYEDNKYATRIAATCTQEGWKLQADACSAPFVADDDGLCKHYSTYLSSSSLSFDFDEHMELMGHLTGLSSEEYYNYRVGDIDDKDRLIMIMDADPALNGRFTY